MSTAAKKACEQLGVGDVERRLGAGCVTVGQKETVRILLCKERKRCSEIRQLKERVWAVSVSECEAAGEVC